MKKLIAIIIMFFDGLMCPFKNKVPEQFLPLDASVVSYFSTLFCFIDTTSNSFYEINLKSIINAKDITHTQVQRSETVITSLFQENSYVYNNMSRFVYSIPLLFY